MIHESIETLENRAHQQRDQIHETAAELRTKVKSAEKALDINSHLKQNFLTAALIASSITFVLGYRIVDLFDVR